VFQLSQQKSLLNINQIQGDRTICAEVFAFNEAEEIAEVIMPEGGPEDCIEEAIETCPVECIYWEEDG
jgi:ferredoxin